MFEMYCSTNAPAKPAGVPPAMSQTALPHTTDSFCEYLAPVHRVTSDRKHQPASDKQWHQAEYLTARVGWYKTEK